MASDRKNWQEKLQSLRAEFVAGLPQRMAQIREAAEGYRADPATVLAPDGALRRLIHNLAGASGTFGYADLGQEARLLEEAVLGLSSSTAPSGADLAKISARLQHLDHLAKAPPTAQEPAPSTPAAGSAPERPALIYILDDERLLAQEITQQLQHFGYECVACFSPDALREAFRGARPDAVVADIGFSEGPLEGPRVLAELQAESHPPVPIIFISVQTDWPARLAAVRAGGVAYLPKPLEMTALVGELDRLTGRHQESPFRVLLVDDEPLLARHYAAVLRNGGLMAEILEDPAAILDCLATFSPDLLLLDLYMPACNGLDLARVVRQTVTYTHLPIVFLSSEQSREEQLVALWEGGDDFIEKPVSPAHLLGAVVARARRFRALRALMNRDSLTGLLNHTNLKLALERELALSHRQGQPLTLAMLDIDHFKSVNDTYGHPVGDRVIKALSRLLVQRLRKVDIV